MRMHVRDIRLVANGLAGGRTQSRAITDTSTSHPTDLVTVFSLMYGCTQASIADIIYIYIYNMHIYSGDV